MVSFSARLSRDSILASHGSWQIGAWPEGGCALDDDCKMSEREIAARGAKFLYRTATTERLELGLNLRYHRGVFQRGLSSSRIVVSGSSASDLAARLEDALLVATSRSGAEVRATQESDPLELSLQVIQMKRQDSLAQAVSFAASAVRRGTRELKGVLWDGTVIRLSVRDAGPKSP